MRPEPIPGAGPILAIELSQRLGGVAVAHDRGGLPEAVDHRGGILVVQSSSGPQGSTLAAISRTPIPVAVVMATGA